MASGELMCLFIYMSHLQNCWENFKSIWSLGATVQAFESVLYFVSNVKWHTKSKVYIVWNSQQSCPVLKFQSVTVCPHIQSISKASLCSNWGKPYSRQMFTWLIFKWESSHSAKFAPYTWVLFENPKSQGNSHLFVTQSFITIFRRPCHCSLSWAR